jgi:hypothetical protein
MRGVRRYVEDSEDFVEVRTELDDAPPQSSRSSSRRRLVARCGCGQGPPGSGVRPFDLGTIVGLVHRTDGQVHAVSGVLASCRCSRCHGWRNHTAYSYVVQVFAPPRLA